ncbi:MAG: hypothetical protein Q4C45_05020 [Oscillospiraceae bacterium]|nr:hypothetical protein [Oscillospiraceae bacterium]
MDNIYSIIGNLLAALAVALLAALVPKARAWLTANLDSTTEAGILRMVQSFTRAAEQLYHDTDPDGKKRQKYVRDQLTALGIEITQAVVSMIEGEVWSINTETKKAQAAEQTGKGESGDGDQDHKIQEAAPAEPEEA